MRPYVLVHGAWHGGWCWKETARTLRATGHEVYTPTLSGLADRSHLPLDGINVDTHIADVAGLIRWEELEDVVLVGHSYGGNIITGVADLMAEKLAALVYVDATVPGVSDPLPTPADLTVPSVPPMSTSAFAVLEEHRARVDRLMTPQPIGCRTQIYASKGGMDAVERRAFIAATDWANGARSRSTLERLQALGGWELSEVAWGHDVMVDHPKELAQYLLQFAR
jgi:pimeloyl-ACP methyl ester carboxylesterase